ncbi:MAG: hypothetical protein GC166_07955 [Alphaproteobacteria bacterium]|nr:hypothetical protein [Alphaproteobacteria bacterium]
MRTFADRLLRGAIASIAMLSLAGCESLGTQQSVGGRIAMQLYKQTFGEPAKISRDAASSIAFATIGVNFGSADQAMMVLGTSRSGYLDWYSSNHVMIQTRKGRVVATSGLPYSLTHLSLVMPGNKPDQNNGALPAPGSHYTLVFDFRDLDVFGVDAACTLADDGPQTIAIIGSTLKTRHLIETCSADAIGWDFENEYWTDVDTGFVWRSVQNPHPKLPEVTIEALRPATDG